VNEYVHNVRYYQTSMGAVIQEDEILGTWYNSQKQVSQLAGRIVMPGTPTKKELEKLAKDIEQDQGKTSSAEKRVKIDLAFNTAMKKMARTKPPKQK
jgi:hypothetical protein